MTYQPEAIRIADGLDQNVQIDPQTSEDEPGGYRSELDELMADAAAILRSQHTRIAKLEAMLDAVGAGGVGQSIKPQVQADTAQKPAAWIDVKPNPFDPSCRGAASVQDHALPPGEHKLYAAPQPTENLRCKSTQKRLATLWGYEKARQPLTDEQILSIVRAAPALDTVEAEFLHIARAIEAAHGITGSQK